MKVLQINKFYYRKGGSESHFIGLVNLLRKNNYEVIVFSTKNKYNIKEAEKDYFIDELEMRLGNFLNGFNLFYNWQAIRTLKKIIHKEKPQIAHLHNISHHFSPAIIKVLKNNNIPIIMTVHDYKLICPNYKLFNKNKICKKCRMGKYYQCALNKCVKDSYLASLIMTLEAYWVKWKKYYDLVDIFIAPSHFMRNTLINNGFSSKKVIYLPNFLEISNKDIKAIGGDGKYVLFFGRISPEKGLDFLVKSFGEIKNKDVKLKIVGNGPWENNLNEMIDSLGLAQRIDFLGYKSKEELKEIVARSELVIVPSIWYENAPYTILESYAFKKAVLGCEIGGIKEMIKVDKTGALFKPNDFGEFVKKIDYLLDNPKKLKELGLNGYVFLKNEFGEKKYLENLLKIYQKEIVKKNIKH